MAGIETSQRGHVLEAKEPTPWDLPIHASEDEIIDAIQNNLIVILSGETGSGKSTQMPDIALKALGGEGKIVGTQPRRIAARRIAYRIAEQEGCEVGEEVGYHIRFDNKITSKTEVAIETDGMLLQEMQGDRLLSKYDVVIMDEMHEKSETMAIMHGLVLHAIEERSQTDKPLRGIILSATMDTQKLSRRLNGAPVIEIPGRQFEIEVHHSDAEVADKPKAAAEEVRDILDGDEEGNIMVFMDGEATVNRTIREIESLCDTTDLEVLPLFADMSSEDQDKAVAKSEKRTVVVSTNVGETSLTPDNVTTVIDSGSIKEKGYNPQTGIDYLLPMEHAQSGCVQRGGRTGRTSPGTVIRLYTEDNFNKRPKFQTPEIQRSNLQSATLRLINLGYKDIESFPFPDPPDHRTVKRAISILQSLGAIDEERELTETGRVMADLPLEPYISRMLIEADKNGCTQEVVTIAAFIDGKNIFLRPENQKEDADRKHDALKVKNSDFLTYLKIWETYERNKDDENWVTDNFLNPDVLTEAGNIRDQLFDILAKNNFDLKSRRDPQAINRSIVSGLTHRLLIKSKGSSYILKDDPTRTPISIHPSSSLKHNDSLPSHMIAAEVVETEVAGRENRVYARTCQPIGGDLLKEFFPEAGKKRRPGKKERREERGKGTEIYSREKDGETR